MTVRFRADGASLATRQRRGTGSDGKGKKDRGGPARQRASSNSHSILTEAGLLGFTFRGMDGAQPGSQVPQVVVERYLDEVLNGCNLAAIDELISDEMLKLRVVSFRSAFPDVAVEARHVVADEALIAVHLIGSGTHEGTFQGCPATGRRWTTSCAAIYRVDGGRIADSWTNWDLLALMEQLGCIQRAETVSA